MAHSTHPSMKRRIVSGIAALPVGFILGSLEGLVRTPLYVLDHISRAIQGVTTGLIFKRVVAFCPSEREYNCYERRDYVEDMLKKDGSSDRVFKICPLRYKTRSASAFLSLEEIMYVVFSPLAVLLNMVSRGVQRVGTFYNIFSGQYGSSNAEEEMPLFNDSNQMDNLPELRQPVQWFKSQQPVQRIKPVNHLTPPPTTPISSGREIPY